MIASRLGVWISAALALVLVLVVALDLARETSPPSRALVASFDGDRVTRLAWTRGKDTPAIELARTDKAWRWTQPVAGIPADASTVDGVLAALRGARWHRRASIAQAGTLHTALTVTLPDRTVKIGIGAPLGGAGQTWIAIGDHAYLVDDWVVRALAPEPLALRETRPFHDIAAASTIVLERVASQRTAVRIEGHPRRLVRPMEVLLSSERAAAIERALANIHIVGTPAPEEMAKPGVAATFSIDGPLVTIDVFSEPCAGAMRIGGTYGPACVEGIERVWEQLDILHRASRDLAEPRLVPFTPARITLADGGVLDLAKRPRIGTDDADVARVAELLALLQTPLDPVDDTTTAAPVGTITVEAPSIVLELLPSHRVRRKGEPVAFPVGAGAWQILTRPSSSLRDPLLWREDPITIEWITVDGTAYRRANVVGEWDHPQLSTKLEALARALATPRGEPLPAPRKTHAELKFTVVPPAGRLVERKLLIGDNCYATVEDKPVVLDKPLCDAIGAMLRR